MFQIIVWTFLRAVLKALHHRQARSIHERKLLSLSLRAGFHMHTHPHAHRLAQAHECCCCCCCCCSRSRSRSRSCYCCFVDSTCYQPVIAASSLQELAAMRNLTTCELDKMRHLLTDVRTSKRHMASSTCLVTRCRPASVLCQHQSSGICFNYVLSDKNDRPLILSDKNRGNVDSTCHQPVIYDVTVNNCYL